MAETGRQFTLVQEDTETDTPNPPPTKTSFFEEAGIQTLALGLSTLSKRTLVAIDNLFCLLTVFSVFWLWHDIPDPNAYQITALGIYAGFVLAANIFARKR